MIRNRRAHSGDAQQHVQLWTTHKHKMCPSQSLDFNQTAVIQIDVPAGIMSELLCCQMANREVFSPNILLDFQLTAAVLCAVWCLCKAHWNSQTQPVCVQIRNPPLCVPQPKSDLQLKKHQNLQKESNPPFFKKKKEKKKGNLKKTNKNKQADKVFVWSFCVSVLAKSQPVSVSVYYLFYYTYK